MLHNPATQKITTAPWQLTGNGYIMLYRFLPGFIAEQGFVAKEMLTSYQGGLSAVMLVNYQDSDVGPYQELLFVPGRFRHNGQSYYSISKIYVSTMASVVSGQHNWGIPKELAKFAFQQQAQNREQVKVTNDGELVAKFILQPVGPQMPATTRLLPHKLHTLIQLRENQHFFTTPGGRGGLRFARLVDVQVNGAMFPDVGNGRLLTTVQASTFHLHFPEAHIQPRSQS